MATSKVSKNKLIKYNSILEASEKLMSDNGLDSLNMDDVAKEAKIAKGTLYLYFKSKEEIIAKLALKARIKLLEAFKKEISTKTNSFDKLKGIISANYNFLKKNRLYYDLVSFYEISERETETPAMQKVIQEIIDLIVGIISDGQKKKEINTAVEPLVLAFSMWGMTVGTMQLLKSKAELLSAHSELSEEKILENFTSMFEAGLKKND